MRARVIAATIAAFLALSGTAEARGFRVHTCVTPDLRLLGPTIDGLPMPSGWTWSSTALFQPVFSDRCATGGQFYYMVGGGQTMTAGQTIWAQWNAAPGTRLTGVSAIWNGFVQLNPARGEGSGQLVVRTDQQTLLVINGAGEASYGYSGAPRFNASLSPALGFEIRFTCLDRCSTPVDAVRVQLTMASFDVDDSASPTGGLVGTATDAQTWAGPMHFGLNAADVGGGVARAIVESDGADALAIPVNDPAGYCHDIGPDPAVAEYAAAQPCPLRIDNGSLDIDSAKLPQGQHTVRVVLEDAAGNRTTIFGPVVQKIAANEAIGPGSDPALRGAANGDGASDQAGLTAHWGKRSRRTLLVSPFGRTHVVRGRLRTLDGPPIASAAIDVVSKTTANNARELVKRGGPRTRSDGSWYLVLPRRVSSRDVSFRYRSHLTTRSRRRPPRSGCACVPA